MTAPGLFGELCIRADAGPAQGIGHVMRCLALAQAWQDRGGTVTFVTATESPGVLARLRDEGCAVVPLTAPPGSAADAAATLATASGRSARFAVVDGYGLTGPYLEALRAGDIPVAAVDDQAVADFGAAALVVNPCVHATAAAYGDVSRVRVLAGPAYALLRREFARPRSHRGPAGHATTVVICLGGSDPPNATGRLLDLLAGFRDWRLEVLVIVGPANPHRAELEVSAQGLASHHAVTLVVDPPDLTAAMARADLAIASASTVALELASLGVPQALAIVADNQREVAAAMDRAGAAVNLGWHGDLQAEPVLAALRPLLSRGADRAALAARARSLVDGAGAGRVAEQLATWPLSLRPATGADATLLHAWANDPVTRQNSFTTDAISWDTHREWFARRLADPDCRLWIAVTAAGEPVGQARVERQGAAGTLSFSVAPAARGRGFASRLVRLAALHCLDGGWCERVEAWVKPDNAASLAAFRRAGFAGGVATERPASAPSHPGALLFTLA